MNVHSPSPLAEPENPGPQDGAGRRWGSITDELDVRRLWRVLLRRRHLFIATGVAIMLATVLLTMQATPKFTAYANVMLDPRTETVTNISTVLSGLPDTTNVVDTEVEVLKSRQLAERVVTALKLDTDPEFNPGLAPPSGLAAVIKGITGLFSAPSTEPPDATALQKQHEAIVDRVLGGLSIKRAGLTYIINVGYQSQSPVKAATIANEFADLYLLEQMEAKFDATRQATKWLNDRLGELRQQVLADDAAVQRYRIANNLMSAAGTNLTESEISSYNQTLSQAQTMLAEDQARLSTAKAQLARGSTGEDVGEALASPVIQQLRRDRATVSQNIADLTGRYGERHPDILKAKRQLDDIDAQIKAEINRLVSNLEAKVQVSRERAASIQNSLGGAKSVLAANNNAMVKLNELQRKTDASQTLYQSYLSRFKETSTQQGIETPDARVVSRAKIPTGQSSPNTMLNLALGFVLALGAGLAVVTVAELLDAGLATAEDIERRLEATYLGAIPKLDSVAEDNKLPPMEYIVDKPLSAFSEAFRNLRTSIAYSRLGEPVKVVVVTSALPGEGKTTTAVCLARASALQGAKVIVVDCDLRRRSLNRLLRAEPTVGLLEVLSGESTLKQAVVSDGETGAAFLPLAESKVTPRDVFGTAAMDRLLTELRNDYDLVLLDTAPVLPLADTRVLAPKADAVVFLTRWRRTPQHAVESAFRLLSRTGAHLAGVALTVMDMKQQAKYGYGDPGYYYAEYRKYYLS